MDSADEFDRRVRLADPSAGYHSAIIILRALCQADQPHASVTVYRLSMDYDSNAIGRPGFQRFGTVPWIQALWMQALECSRTSCGRKTNRSLS